jgi:hypothetical protein
MMDLLDKPYPGTGEQIFIMGGDRLPDLTPPGDNLSNRLVKHLRIAGSGLYKYRRDEAQLYGLDEKVLPGDQDTFTIYRPAEVLAKHANMFARIPIITGHHVLVNDSNAKRLMVGMVGDEVIAEVDPRDKETYLVTTGTILAGDGIKAYEKWGQLSVGYVPVCHWEAGVYRGQHYDAVLTGFRDVNHLLICEQARGGPQCMVMDSIDDTPLERFIKSKEGNMNIFKKIFGSQPVVGDERVPLLLKSIAVGADPATQVTEIRRVLASQKIAGDALTTLNEYLDELSTCKDEKLEIKSKACDIVAEFYQKSIAGDEDKDKDGDKDKKTNSPPAGDEDKDKDKEPPAKDEDRDKDKGKDADKKSDPPAAGDEYIKKADLEKVIQERMAALFPKKEDAPLVNAETVGALNALIGGDEKRKAASTDDFMKNVFGKEKKNGAIW